MKKLVRKVCSNIDNIENLLLKYDLELIYIPDTIENYRKKHIENLRIEQIKQINELVDRYTKNIEEAQSGINYNK